MISGFFSKKLRSDRNLDSPWRQKSRTTKNINCNNKTIYYTELTRISGLILDRATFEHTHEAENVKPEVLPVVENDNKKSLKRIS